MQMMDTICEVIPKLKRFEYRANYTYHLESIISNHSMKSNSKFMELNSIGIEFKGRKIPGVDIKANYFQVYLLAKCPKIDRILIRKRPAGWSIGYTLDEVHPQEQVVFRSPNNDRFSFSRN